VTLEIGFGLGDVLVELARRSPATNFVGIEIFRAGHATVLSKVREHGLTNVRLVGGDAFKILANHLAPRCVDDVMIFFPDPWTTSDERKIVRPEVLDLLASRMRFGSKLFIATDVEAYAAHITRVMAQPELGAAHGAKWVCTSRGAEQEGRQEGQVGGQEGEEGEEGKEGRDGKTARKGEADGIVVEEWAERPEWRPMSKYESKGLEEGRRSHNFEFVLRHRRSLDGGSGGGGGCDSGGVLGFAAEGGADQERTSSVKRKAATGDPM
jgi:tRNA (guanine-N(7)-)-methyltransferase